MKEKFEIGNLPTEQENSLRKFLRGQDIFANLLTQWAKNFNGFCYYLQVGLHTLTPL